MTSKNQRAAAVESGLLSPSSKYAIWIGLLRGGSTISEAAERADVDRSTVMKLRKVAKHGELEALAASLPGVKARGVDPRAGRGARGDRQALGGAEGDRRQVDAGLGKGCCGLSGPVPAPPRRGHEGRAATTGRR